MNSRLNSLIFPSLVSFATLLMTAIVGLRIAYLTSISPAGLIVLTTLGSAALILFVFFIFRKRSSSFSVRQMLVVFLLFGIALASIADPIRRLLRQRTVLPKLAAAEVYPYNYDFTWIEKATGMNPFENIDLVIVQGDNGLVTLVEHLDQLPSLAGIDFDSGVGDNGLKGLSHFNDYPKINTCNIFSKDITDEGITSLVNWRHLETLNLNGCDNLTSHGIEKLVSLRSLKHLFLLAEGSGKLDVRDKTLQSIGQLHQLEKLILVDVPISDKGLQHLNNVTNLRQLALRGTQVTPQGVSQLLDSLPDLEVIYDGRPLTKTP